MTLTIVSLIIVIAVLAYSIYPFQAIVKEFGGKYDAKVSYYDDTASLGWYIVNRPNGEYDATAHYYGYRVQLTYTDETGSHSSSNFDDTLIDGLNWINSSTPESATFLGWWDYGHMIKAIGERNPIIRNPSHEIINSIADPSGIKEHDSHEKISDVASAFTPITKLC
jgi:asparagine N-glycosylation enzyme membrane subunit Stt3